MRQGRASKVNSLPCCNPNDCRIIRFLQREDAATTQLSLHSTGICLHRKKINLSTEFAGQAIGIKEVEEGIWLVSFMNYDLSYVDPEEKTLQPLNNRFGPKV